MFNVELIISIYKILNNYVFCFTFRKSDKQENPPKPLFIGAHNVFEVGCKLESPFGHIGESNVFECRSFVGMNVKIGSGCVIGKHSLVFIFLFFTGHSMYITSLLHYMQHWRSKLRSNGTRRSQQNKELN